MFDIIKETIRRIYMIKAIFFDIDGTLASFKTHQIPDSTFLYFK